MTKSAVRFLKVAVAIVSFISAVLVCAYNVQKLFPETPAAPAPVQVEADPKNDTNNNQAIIIDNEGDNAQVQIVNGYVDGSVIMQASN